MMSELFYFSRCLYQRGDAAADHTSIVESVGGIKRRSDRLFQWNQAIQGMLHKERMVVFLNRRWKLTVKQEAGKPFAV